MNRHVTRTILAIGRHDQWPEPMASLIAAGSVAVETVATLHEAAATWVLAPESYNALVLDTQVLSSQELAGISILRRHIPQPVWLLPGYGPQTRVRQALALGAIPWEDAASILAQWLEKGITPISQISSRENPQDSPLGFLDPNCQELGLRRRPDAADKIAPIPTENSAEIPVVADIVARYDGMTGAPLLSDHEIRALLGTAE